MEFLPLSFKLKNKRSLIVGGGSIALRKARLLLKADATIHVVAPQIEQELATLVEDAGGSCALKAYEESDLDGIALVVVATNDKSVNQQISKQAQLRYLPVNVVDQPELCSFIMPAIIDRSPLTIAISSSGQSPVLARLLRGKVESLIPAAYGRLAGFAGQFRSRVKKKFIDINQRRKFWEQVLEGPVAEMVLAGNERQATEALESLLESNDAQPSKGEVYLVGAGPGDPDLLTFKALRLMQRADVILYDRLVSSAVMDLVRRDADLIYVGKARSDHVVPQQDINKLLVEHASQGKRVLRLKGGDPFVFGRGGEEIEHLASHGIPFQVVPGITAASGCSCYAGIPLTHRDYAQSVRFVTGHLKNGEVNLPWAELVFPHETVVIYMGLIGLEMICAQLIDHGRSPETPIALIQQGTLATQKTVISTLAEMPNIQKVQEFKPPTLIIVGEVVELHGKLAWYNP